MAYTFKDRFKPSYLNREELGIHAGTGSEIHDWHVVGAMPEIWEDIEEWRTVKDKRDAFGRCFKWDSVERQPNLPARIPVAYHDRKMLVVMSAHVRDQLKANGHYHLVTTRTGGFEYYLFAQTWDLIEDITSFDSGIDYMEGSMP